MKKLSGIMICLSAIVLLRCTEEQAAIDPTSLFALTSGFSSSYMSFTITAGVTGAPEYKVLNTASGLALNGTNYEGTFTYTGPVAAESVTIALPSPAQGAEYLENSPSLFSYTRGSDNLTINSAYSTGNDFIVTITEWGGSGRFMKATFSGVVCRESDCVTIENGKINALIR